MFTWENVSLLYSVMVLSSSPMSPMLMWKSWSLLDPASSYMLYDVSTISSDT